MDSEVNWIFNIQLKSLINAVITGDENCRLQRALSVFGMMSTYITRWSGASWIIAYHPIWCQKRSPKVTEIQETSNQFSDPAEVAHRVGQLQRLEIKERGSVMRTNVET
ncbi:hypothetical protein BY996DRAFT_8391671 [Phakopsora pachyrhizi]|nr:hypothetical protein BY996DRAFT_8391671 [Phakopsora pachyrhizi]